MIAESSRLGPGIEPHTLIGRTYDQDYAAVEAGILDEVSFRDGYLPQRNPVIGIVRRADGSLKQLGYGGNMRTNVGGSWQMSAMGGDVAAGISACGLASACTATTLTSTTTTSTTTQYVGHVLYVNTSPTNMVFGRIKSHTNGGNAVFTVDQWYLVGSLTGAVGTTPTVSATVGTYVISDSQGPGYWIALSTDTATSPTGTDTTLVGEVSITTYFSAQLARVRGTFAPTAPVGNLPNTTNPGSYTQTGPLMVCTSSVGIGHVAIFDCLTGGQLLFNKLYSTPYSCSPTDTFQPVWSDTAS